MYNLDNITRRGRVAAALVCTFALPTALSVPVQAQMFHRHQTTTSSGTHRSWMHRHPTATTAGAGVGAYALAKHSKHGIFHRHPVLTGIGAAAVAHHYAKKHNR